MGHVFTHFDEITPDLLTQLFRERGHLPGGYVTGVERIDSWKTRLATLARFAVLYSDDAPDDCPRQLIFKAPRPELLPTTRREVDIYSRVAEAMPNGPLVRCFDARYDDESGTYHLLLEDVTETHCTDTPGLPPTRGNAERIVDALAELHAFWWDHPRLGQDIAETTTQFQIRRVIAHAQCHYPRMLAALGDRLPPDGQRTFEAAFAYHGDLLSQRLIEERNLTLVHGDAHTMNFLLPRALGAGRTYIIDWHSPPWVWQCWLGVSDLAYLMVRYWPAARRRELEKQLLERYHQKLRGFGVTTYGWDQLWEDYRLSAISSLYVVIEESVRVEPWRWFQQLENTLCAMEDLDCLSVLQWGRSHGWYYDALSQKTSRWLKKVH